MSWSKITGDSKKPVGWWYHKVMCELSWHIFNDRKWYYYHLDKMCDKYNIDLYGEKI